jgi:hypothetical protein
LIWLPSSFEFNFDRESRQSRRDLCYLFYNNAAQNTEDKSKQINSRDEAAVALYFSSSKFI